MVIAITRSNYIKRLPVTTYREQKRGGQGVMGMDLKEDDYIEHLFVASTHDYVLFFTNVGKVYRLKVHELPLGSRQSKGRAISEPAAVPSGRAGARRHSDARLRGGEVPRLRDEGRDRQEDRARRLQHAAQGRRDHRDQDARRRRARLRPALHGRRRHPDGLAHGPGDPLQREAGAPDGPRHRRRQRHGPAQGRRGDLRRRHRRQRGRPARRDRERLRQADASWPTTRARAAAALASRRRSSSKAKAGSWARELSARATR